MLVHQRVFENVLKPPASCWLASTFFIFGCDNAGCFVAPQKIPGLSQDSKVLGRSKRTENPIPHGDPMWFWCWKIPSNPHAIVILLHDSHCNPIPSHGIRSLGIIGMKNIGGNFHHGSWVFSKSHGRIQHFSAQVYRKKWQKNPDGKVRNLEM